MGHGSFPSRIEPGATPWRPERGAVARPPRFTLRNDVRRTQFHGQ
jgi:hypothetical protein